MDPVNVPAKFEVHSFTCCRDSDWSFGWGLWTPNLAEEEVGDGSGTIRKSVGEFL